MSYTNQTITASGFNFKKSPDKTIVINAENKTPNQLLTALSIYDILLKV